MPQNILQARLKKMNYKKMLYAKLQITQHECCIQWRCCDRSQCYDDDICPTITCSSTVRTCSQC